MNKFLKLGRVLCAALALVSISAAVVKADAVDKPYYQPISPAGVYKATFNTLGDGQVETLTLDSTGALRIDCILGCGGGTGGGTLTMPFAGNIDAQASGSAQATGLMGFNGTAWDRLRSTSGSLNTHVDNFPSGFNVNNFPATQNVALTGVGASSGNPIFDFLTNWPTAAAGTPNANVLTVQGITNGIALGIDLTNWGTNGANALYTQITNWPAQMAVTESGPGSAIGNPLYVADTTQPSPCPLPGCTVVVSNPTAFPSPIPWTVLSPAPVNLVAVASPVPVIQSTTAPVAGSSASNTAVTNPVLSACATIGTGTYGPIATSANQRNITCDQSGELVVRGPTQLFDCNATAVGTSAVQCGAAPTNPLRYFITDITVKSTTSTASGFALVQGTGTNCGTGQTYVYPSSATIGTYYAPPNTGDEKLIHFTTPRFTGTVQQLCVIGASATNTINIEIHGYDAP